jgi:hypothetical protein
MPTPGDVIIYKAWKLDQIDVSNSSDILVKKNDEDFGYTNIRQLATTGSNTFVGNQTINGNLTINGNITANNFITSSTLLFTGSTNHGSTNADTHTFTGSVKITGSFDVIGPSTSLGNTSISGALSVSGSTTFSGIHRLSGSNTILGNTTMSGSVNITGSTNIRGTTNFSNSSTTITGSLLISGSTTQIGNNTLLGNTTLSGSVAISGSMDVNGNINVLLGSDFYLHGNKLFNYGQWISLQTQSGSANTAYAMKFETATSDGSGMYVGNNGSGLPTRIYVENTGLYNIQFSAQLHTTANEACDFSVWFAMTGSAIANSNTDFSIEKLSGGGFQVAALNFLTPITSGSYVELYWSKTTANGQLQAKGVQSTPTRPATPSVIVTLTQIA